MDKPKTREEALKLMRERMAQDKSEAYADYQYYQKEVQVYKVGFMNNTSIYVSKGVGEAIQEGMIKEDSSSVIKLGSGVWRVYEFKSVVPETVRFAELSEWTRHKVLEEEPGLLDEFYKNCSPKLKECIDRISKGKNLDSNLRIC